MSTQPQPRRPQPRVIATLMDAGNAHVHVSRTRPGGPIDAIFYGDDGSVALEDRSPTALRQLLTDAVAQLDAIDGGSAS